MQAEIATTEKEAERIEGELIDLALEGEPEDSEKTKALAAQASELRGRLQDLEGEMEKINSEITTLEESGSETKAETEPPSVLEQETLREMTAEEQKTLKALRTEAEKAWKAEEQEASQINELLAAQKALDEVAVSRMLQSALNRYALLEKTGDERAADFGGKAGSIEIGNYLKKNFNASELIDRDITSGMTSNEDGRSKIDRDRTKAAEEILVKHVNELEKDMATTTDLDRKAALQKRVEEGKQLLEKLRKADSAIRKNKMLPARQALNNSRQAYRSTERAYGEAKQALKTSVQEKLAGNTQELDKVGTVETKFMKELLKLRDEISEK